MACACGATLDVPRLGELRRLPPAPDPQAPAAGGWNARHGALAAGLIAAAVLSGAAGWFAANEPAPPEPFDAAARQAFVDQQIDQMGPADLFRMQVTIYEPLARKGLQKAESPRDKALEQQIQQSKLFQTALWSAAAFAAVAGVVAFAAIPR